MRASAALTWPNVLSSVMLTFLCRRTYPNALSSAFVAKHNEQRARWSQGAPHSLHNG
jgi:hypothetical protein